MKSLTGILLPVFSLPGTYGIGRFSKEAYAWIDLLVEAQLNAWQVCPMGPTSFGNSPYQPLSEIALNPLFIDLEDLVQRNLLSSQDLQKTFTSEDVDYDTIKLWQFPLLLKAYENFLKTKNHTHFHEFKKSSGKSLETYCIFCALKNKFHQKPWWEWPHEYRNCENNAVKTYQKNYQKFVDFFAFEQWILTEQWEKIHHYARQRGITIVGDIPLYVGMDSAIVWQNRSLFQWDFEKDQPKQVAGVPPDYFSTDGQLWGNPLYDWEQHQKENFSWWVERIRKNFDWFDVIRIDHFRGLYDYWAIPYGEKTAQKGQWLPGPQHAFFNTLKHYWPHMPFILEDLGDLHEGVRTFQKNLRLSGMAIAQFAFGGENNPYLPQNWSKNQVIYTGTHDNDTLQGWFSKLKKIDKEQVIKTARLRSTTTKNIAPKLIQWLFKHRTTQHIILPLQDVLNLSSKARINTPGTIGKNWQWRCSEENFKQFIQAFEALKAKA